jgi:hypothetical protein
VSPVALAAYKLPCTNDYADRLRNLTFLVNSLGRLLGKDISELFKHPSSNFPPVIARSISMAASFIAF